MNPGTTMLLVNVLGWGGMALLLVLLQSKRSSVLDELHRSHRSLTKMVSDIEKELHELTMRLRERDEVAKISISAQPKEQKASHTNEDEAFRLSSSGVRWKAVVSAGGKTGDLAGSIEALVKSLKDDSVRVRLGALTTLAKIGDRSIVPHLIEAMGDPNEVVRRRAVRSLQELTHVDHGEDRQAWLRWWEKTRFQP